MEIPSTHLQLNGNSFNSFAVECTRACTGHRLVDTIMVDTQYQLDNLRLVRGIYYPNNINNANNFIYLEIVYIYRDKLSQFEISPHIFYATF